MPKLLRITDGSHGLDEVVSDVHREGHASPPLGVDEAGPGLAIDLGEAHGDDAKLFPRPPRPGHDSHDALASVDRAWERHRLAPPVGVGHDVRGEQADEPFRIALLDRCEEPPSQLLAALLRRFEAWLPGLDVAAGTDEDLSAVVLALSDRGSDLLVAVVEYPLRRNTARSTGVRLSSRTRNAIESESAVSACRTASDSSSVRMGSGSPVPK